MTLNEVTIAGGKADAGATGYIGGGGGIRNEGTVLLRNSTVKNNSGATSGSNDGGGILNFDGGKLTVINCTITGNTGFGGTGGGGILNYRISAPTITTIINSTIFENRADGPAGYNGRGDAIAEVFSPVGSSAVVVKNSILASPTRGINYDCYSGYGQGGRFQQTSLGHNIIGDSSGAPTFTATGDLNSTDPLLAALASNGGPTQTHAPFPGSPAINGVPLADCTDANGAPIPTDQRGIVRPQGVACDIGSVERVNAITGPPCFEVLKTFTGLDGANPVAGLIQDSAGVLYGTAYLGGTAFQPGNVGYGTVFKLNPDGSGFAVIKDFAASTIGTTGASPVAGLMRGTDGALYGTAYLGGSSGYGTVFRLNPDGTGFTVLKNFDSSTTGDSPFGELMQGTDGALYGTAPYGGTFGYGTVFKLNPDGTGFTVLKHFDSSTSGDTPVSGLIQGAGGTLYGTAAHGGSGGSGTVFRLNPNGTGFTVLKNFASSTTGGNLNAGLMRGTDGALYSTAYEGGSSGSGTVFKLNPDGTGFIVLKNLDSSTTGANPIGEMIQGTDGVLYGTAYLGGISGDGTVFKLNPDGSDFAVLHHFNPSTISIKPYANLMQGADGNLYGTTRYGGDDNSDGTVFRIVLNCSPDVTPPDTIITSGPSGIVASAAATFAFTGSDDVTLPAGLTFEASLDGAAFTPATSPLNYTGLLAGAHTFAVRAIDASGKTDPTPATRTWTVGIETTPPDTTITAGPGGVVANAAATFTFTGSDNITPPAGLTFEVSLDGGAFTPASSPKSDTGLAESLHTFKVRAIDAAGNADPTPATRYWSVMQTAVFSWGYNGNGQLGDGTTTERHVPGTVLASGALAGKTVTDIAGCGFHSLALTSDGQLFAWGYNGLGQLGDGTTAIRSVPVAVTMTGALSGKTVTAIAGGARHSLALTSDGQLFAWGQNDDGQLGDGTTADRSVPVAVTMSGALLGKTVVAIAAGVYHSSALTSDGRIFAWGLNADGQLGDGTTSSRTTPVAVTMNGVLAGETVVAIAAGYAHNFALTEDGQLFAWGRNDNGQLGDGTITNRHVPVAVIMSGAPAGRSVLEIAGGGFHTIALTGVLPIDTWTTETFGPDANNPAIAGKLANPDGDAFNNILEYAFGTDPLNPGSTPTLGPSFDGGLLTLTYQHPVAATDIDITVEETANLFTWTQPVFLEQILFDNGIMQTIQVGVPISPGPAQFIKARGTEKRAVLNKGVSGL